MFGRKSKGKKPKSRKKKLIIWAVVLIVLTSLVAYAAYLLNRPAEGVVSKGTISNVTEVADATIETLENDFFTLQYPGEYDLLEAEQSKSASIVSRTLLDRGAMGLGLISKISISIDSLDSKGITEDSAYKHAEAFPEFYNITETTYTGESTKVLERSNPSYERTILWPHNGYILTVSLTAPEKTDDLVEQLDTIMQSVAWHK